MIGKTLGHYRVGEQLGRGGMGEVYAAEDLNLNRKVALKFLPEAFAADPERMARFEREAKLLASLNHPNIAAIYGLEQAEGKRFLVLELVEGETLAQRLSKGPLSVEDALGVCRQIADALEAAHEKGVIHRDLKPANVMIAEGGKVKILDFGLAKALSDETQSVDSSQSPTLTEAMTRPGVILGTAAYMSPEQAKGKAVDKRTDIWAFGCILYECLAGKRVFEGETVTETLAAILKGEPDWQALPPTTPPNIRFVLRRCLEKDMGRRLRDAADVRVVIEEASGFVEKPMTVKRSWLAWSIAALLLLTLAPVAFLHFREAPPPASQLVRFTIPLPEKMSFARRGEFALSPDGRWLVFSAADSDNVGRLWIRALGSLEVRALPRTESLNNTPSLFWSPDSRMIAFEAGGKLKKVDIVGEVPQTICDLPGPVYGGSWNREDVIIFGSIQGLMRVSAKGGVASPLTVLGPALKEAWHRYPTFLPDGRHFLYVRRSQENSGVYLGSLDAKPAEQSTKLLAATTLSSVYVHIADTDRGQLLFLREGMLLAQAFDSRRLAPAGEPIGIAEPVGIVGSYALFSASANGTMMYRGGWGQGFQHTWFDRQGKALGTEGSPGTFNLGLALSPDGARFAAGRGDAAVTSSDIWLHDFSRGTDTRLTFGKGMSSWPVWSHDGSRIIFASNRDGSGFNLYQKPASGVKNEELLLKSSESLQRMQPTSWSSDGRFLLYSGRNPKTTNWDLWVLPLEGDRKPNGIQ
jgi:serine/threonine protein kinase